MIRVYNESFSLQKSIQAHTVGSIISRIRQLPNGYVGTVCNDAKVKIWNITSNITSWDLIRTYSGHSSPAYIYAIEVLNNDTVATGAYIDNRILIWSICTGVTLRTINVEEGIVSLKLLCNGYHLASGSYTSGRIRIYDLNDGSLVVNLTSHVGRVEDLILIGCDLLVSSGQDNTVRIWNLTTYTIKFNLTGHSSAAIGLKLVSYDVLASGSADSTIKLWNISSGVLIRTLSNHSNQVQWSVNLLNNNGQTLVSGSNDMTIKLWNWTTGECLKTFNTVFSIRVMTILDSNDAASPRIYNVFF
jgi:WD40 repeat protein